MTGSSLVVRLSDVFVESGFELYGNVEIDVDAILDVKDDECR